MCASSPVTVARARASAPLTQGSGSEVTRPAAVSVRLQVACQHMMVNTSSTLVVEMFRSVEEQ